MSLYADWKQTIEDNSQTAAGQRAFWDGFCEREKHIYEDLLGRQETRVTGTVAAFAKKYAMPETEILGFLDGISESLTNAPPTLDEVTADREWILDIDWEKLYWNMVKVPAPWLYELPQWEGILSADRRKAIYKKCRARNTVIKEQKVGRNDPCPCGSGKKYKKCCGRI